MRPCRRLSVEVNITDFVEPAGGPKKSALQKLQEDMQRQLAPFRESQRMQEILESAAPDYHFRKLMRDYEPYRQIQELLKRPAIPKHIQEILDSTSTAAHAKRLMDQVLPRHLYPGLGFDSEAMRRAAGLDTVSQALKQHEQLLKPVVQQQEWLEKLQRQAFGGVSALEFARHLGAANPAIRAMQDARRAVDGILGQFRDIDLYQFEADEEDEQEAQAAVRQITQAATDQASFQGSVDRIVAAIQHERKPSVQLMLWLVFRKVMDYLIAGAIGAVMSHYAPLALGEPPQAAKKAINETARLAVASPELLAEYRYVSAKLLVVRQNPRALSPEIARLTFAKPVKLLKKDKDFALVVWTDQEAGAEIQGWVFARHLSKFR